MTRHPSARGYHNEQRDMNYISTRGGAFAGGAARGAGFSDILLEGLAPDGGLAVPESYPQVSSDELDAWRTLSYPELALEVIRKFVTDIPLPDLRGIVMKTYIAETFGNAEITPLTDLGDGLHLLGLSNGPTLAFKDLAMQLLGNLFEYALAKSHRSLNILGATSGDTGSAAEYAMRGKTGIRVFMLSPAGKMSAFQTAQMFSLADPNIFNLAVDGVFDDCQDIVKAVSGDAEFKRRQSIGTVNSINWARIVAQVVYYFRGYLSLPAQRTSHLPLQGEGRDGDGFPPHSTDPFRSRTKVSFTVPSGNFGNICAGHIARMMGLPIAELVCATNENDVLDEFFRTGIYRVRSAAETHATSSPSMDISKASNFERFVFDLVDRDPARMKSLWTELEREGRFDLSATPLFAALSQRFGFASGQCNHAGRVATIRELSRARGIVVDPHTAVAIKVAEEHREAGIPMIVLETARPAKFAETIREALGVDPEVPRGYQDLLDRPQRFTSIAADAEAVKRFIVERTQ